MTKIVNSKEIIDFEIKNEFVYIFDHKEDHKKVEISSNLIQSDKFDVKLSFTFSLNYKIATLSSSKVLILDSTNHLWINDINYGKVFI